MTTNATNFNDALAILRSDIDQNRIGHRVGFETSDHREHYEIILRYLDDAMTRGAIDYYNVECSPFTSDDTGWVGFNISKWFGAKPPRKR